jgi:isopropylmalate/homocitrate/citramalate synthase
VGIKIRICDTMGYGVTYPGSALPRSVPKLVRAMIEDGGLPRRAHGMARAQRLYKVLINASTAWLYGCAGVNGTLLGFGERTGNTPVEALVIEHISLHGKTNGADTRVISEIADYFSKEIGHRIPSNAPLLGRDFNCTSRRHPCRRVDQEPGDIQHLRHRKAILGRPFSIAVTDKSGAAGVAHWVNQRLGL